MIPRLFEKFLYGIYTLMLLGALLGITLYFVLSRDLPQLPAQIKNINLRMPTEIYASDGALLRTLGERRTVSLEEISPFFLKAIMAVEDSRFYDHDGIDHLSLARAMWHNVQAGRVKEGASTITQQLSKNLFLTFERSWVRKLKEALIALQMEATFSKDDILEAYCNQVNFGSNAYGVEDASQTYFGKPAKDISLLQAALLAGLPNSPSSNPFNRYDWALKRARFVLDRMVKVKAITFSQRDDALKSPVGLVTPRTEKSPSMYFVDFVVENLEKEYGSEFVHFGGLKIFTTLDLQFQEMALKAAQTHLEALDKRMAGVESTGPLQVALANIENKTGAVRVLLGGRNYSQSQFNRSVSHNRLPGSSFKPFVYLTAMNELGYNPATVVRDEPLTIEIPGSPPWEPKNFENSFAGDIILKKALMKSINVVSAKMTNEVTPKKVIQTARQMGITSPLGNNMSLALGTSGVSPLEIASAYSTIANLGVFNPPYIIQKIEDYNGNVLHEHFYQGEQRFSKKAIYPLLDMMQGVVSGGTGRVVRRLGFKHAAGGKTGTTNDFKDAWFNGFTHDYSTSVWVGYDDNQRMIDPNGRGLTGGGAAAPIWTYFMSKVHQDKNPVKFMVPEGIKFATVDAHTGYLADEKTVEPMRVAVDEKVNLIPPPVVSPVNNGSLFDEATSTNVQETSNGLPNF